MPKITSGQEDSQGTYSRGADKDHQDPRSRVPARPPQRRQAGDNDVGFEHRPSSEGKPSRQDPIPEN